jgi:hypothetical protein
MKSIRMLGFAIAAALAATAFIGAGSASATVLCKAAQADCTPANTYPAETEIGAQATSLTFHTSIIDIKCTSSGLEAVTEAEAGTPLDLLARLTFGGCATPGGSSCSVEMAPGLGGVYETAIAWTSGNNGTLLEAFPRTNVNCTGGIICTYSSVPGGTKFAVTGGNPATVTASKVALAAEGPFCPASTTVSVTYTVQSPKPLFVSQK